MVVSFKNAEFRLGEEGELFITVRTQGNLGWV